MKKRLLSGILLVAFVLSSLVLSLPASAATQLAFGEWQSATWDDGGYWMSNLSVSGSGDTGLTITEEAGSDEANRCIWAFENSLVEQMPYLIYEVEDATNFEKMEVTKRFSTEMDPELLPLETTAGEHCVSLLDLLEGKDTIGYTYVIPYAAKGTSVTFKKLYLSDTDLDGNVYTPPTMPPVPNGDDSHAIRYPLRAYTQDTVDEDGYGWLMSVGADGQPTIVCTPDTENKSFTLQRAEGRKEEYINIAWVVSYEQLQKTPYLVLDIANDGRTDEGPKINLFAYWEHAEGSDVYFDNIKRKDVFANSLSGVNKWPLKYAIDEVPEEKRSDDGIAIIVRLFVDRTDGTTLEPLRINEAYLLGYEEGYEEGGQYYTQPSVTEGTGAVATTVAPDGDKKESDTFPWIAVWIAGGVVLAGVVVAVVLVIRKKKKG